ncbi:Gag-Pol polyprotein [Taenia solium]|eukprot:TsM_001088100 transcript=TsM_001088100 gene=TsM_001088100
MGPPANATGVLFLPRTYQTSAKPATCYSFKRPHSTVIAPLRLILTGFTGERVGIDILGPPPLTRRGNCCILVMINYFRKAAEAEHMKSQGAEKIASAFLNRWIYQRGVLELVRSHQGPGFESRLFIELCKTFGVAKTRTTHGHLQGNGQVKRKNCTPIGLLKAFTKKAQPEDRDSSLGRTVLAHRATVHASGGVSLFEMLTGRKMRVLSHIFLPSKEVATGNAPKHVLRQNEGIKKTLTMAQLHSQTSFSRQKKYYDKHSRPNAYHEGDLVQLYRPTSPSGTQSNL